MVQPNKLIKLKFYVAPRPCFHLLYNRPQLSINAIKIIDVNEAECRNVGSIASWVFSLPECGHYFSEIHFINQINLY